MFTSTFNCTCLRFTGECLHRVSKAVTFLSTTTEVLLQLSCDANLPFKISTVVVHFLLYLPGDTGGVLLLCRSLGIVDFGDWSVPANEGLKTCTEISALCVLYVNDLTFVSYLESWLFNAKMNCHFFCTRVNKLSEQIRDTWNVPVQRDDQIHKMLRKCGLCGGGLIYYLN